MKNLKKNRLISCSFYGEGHITTQGDRKGGPKEGGSVLKLVFTGFCKLGRLSFWEGKEDLERC